MKILWIFCVTMHVGRGVEAQRLPEFSKYFEGSPLGKVQSKKVGHFHVSWVHPKDEIIVDALIKHISLADVPLAGIFRDQSGDYPLVPIEIYPDLKSFSAVSGLALARFKATGTIALTLDQRLMILSPRNLTSGYNWAVTIVHEYIHYLIRTLNQEYVPIWLHEGTAQLFQGYPYSRDVQLQPAQWGLFKKFKRQKKLLSLETLKEPFPYRKDPEEAEMAYIQALLFAQWLDKKCGVVNLIRWAEEMKGIDPALEKCTKMSLKKLSDIFISSILGGVRIPSGSDVEYFARDFSGADPVEVEGRKGDQKSRNLAQLSDKLFDQGRFKAASFEMERALKVTPASPPSWRRQLALSLAKWGQESQSEQILEDLLRDYPEDAGGWYLRGMSQKAKGQIDDAWHSLTRAFFVNPFMEGLQDEMQVLKEKNPGLDFVLK